MRPANIQTSAFGVRPEPPSRSCPQLPTPRGLKNVTVLALTRISYIPSSSAVVSKRDTRLAPGLLARLLDLVLCLDIHRPLFIPYISMLRLDPDNFGKLGQEFGTPGTPPSFDNSNPTTHQEKGRLHPPLPSLSTSLFV